MQRRWKALLMTLLVILTSCSGNGGDSSSSPTPNTPSDDPSVLNIVAGSEQRGVVDVVVQPWCAEQDLTCNVTYMGSVDQARLLQSGTAPYDAFWFASSVFAQLGDQNNVLTDVEPMSLTPLVFSGWQSEMEALGFVGRDVSIDEILEAVESGRIQPWVTNPTQSNSGATTYFGVLNHVSGNPDGVALTEAQLASSEVQEGISSFVRGFGKTPSSTGTLMRDCIADEADCRTMFTYENLVMEYNTQLVADGHEPLYAIYPTGVLAISDAPLGFLPHGTDADAEKRANFQALQAYLLSDDARADLLNLGRRPADITGLSLENAPSTVFNPDWGIATTINGQQLVYPAAPVIEEALSQYQLSFRTPSDVYYCIDGSGSMQGGGWNGVTRAADLLFNPAEAEQYFLQVSPRDRTTVEIFDHDVRGGPWTVEGDDPEQVINLRDSIQGTRPDGGTAIYDCLDDAVNFYDANPDGTRQPLVILMSDGQNTDGGTAGLDNIAALGVPVITIAFGGNADSRALQEIADRTNGAFIQTNDLVGALREAASYR